MKQKLKSDKGLFGVFKGVKLGGVIMPLLLGALLIILSGNLGSEKSEEQENALSELCSYVDGVGRCYAEASYDSEGEVFAVAVMCEGADNTEVRSELYRLISSFYGIGYNRISVLKISE